MLEQLLAILKEKGIDTAELDSFIIKFKKLENEVNTLDLELNKVRVENETNKNSINSFKTKLNIEDIAKLDERIAELTKKQNSATDDLTKKEMKELEDLIKAKDLQIDTIKKEYDSKLFDKDLNLELYKRSASLNSINAEAHKIIIDKLKTNAVFENGEIVYKNEDGTYLRKNGISLNLDDRINELKTGEYSFLFKNDSKSGSGIVVNENNTNTNSANLSDFAKKMLERAKNSGINLQN